MGTSEVVVATSAEDAAAVDAVKAHHAELSGKIAALTEALLSAVERDASVFEQARAAAVAVLTGELLPHAEAEERALYPAAATDERARMLVETMIAEHRVIGDLAQRVATESSPVRAAAAGYALRVLFDSHLVKENEQILPVIAADPAQSLAGITHGMHELLGASHEHAPAAGGCGGHTCACSAVEEQDDPVLDVREVPHAIRHATVFGAFDTVPTGSSLVLIAPHDPLPLLRQLTDRADGKLGVDYEERGPEAWRLRLTRL